ncbi:MAG: S16 family serine protease [Lachnospirales bacterium]
MYHLEQEAFLRAWIQVQDQDIFVVGEDLAWVDLVQENWDTPMDWGGFYREDHHIEFRQVSHIQDYLCEIKKKKWQVETDGEYIWAENLIQETYQQQVQKLLKTLREEAARQGFRVRIENEEIQFEGAGDSSMLCQIAADLSGAVRRVRKEEEERLQWFRARVLEQIGSGLSDPFILACSKSWQYYDPQKSLWNSVEDGRLCPGQLIQCGCLVVPIQGLMQDQKAYCYLKRVWKEKYLKDWWNGEYLVEQPLSGNILEPIPYYGKIVIYGTWEWWNLWKQTDPEWAKDFQRIHWKSQCPYDQEHRKEFRKHLSPCSRDDEKALLYYMRRGALPGQMWTDMGKIEGLLPQARERIEERLQREEREDELQNLRAQGVGEINGIAICSDGTRSVGIPVKIQALCSRRRGRSRSLEKYSGPIYQKGMEVLKEYWGRISHRYSFTILMEGNYHYLEGDSATIAQLYAVLSAAGQYLPQSGIVVTGAMNLKGDVLPIGSVTEKAEAAYRSGAIGFIYPRDNRQDLYLRPSVIEAAQQGRFHLWPIRRVEEGAELLFGKKWKTIIRKI